MESVSRSVVSPGKTTITRSAEREPVIERDGLREKGRSYGGEVCLEAAGQGGAERRRVGEIALRAGTPFPGYLEWQEGPARPVHSSSGAARTGRGRAGVEGDQESVQHGLTEQPDF